MKLLREVVAHEVRMYCEWEMRRVGEVKVAGQEDEFGKVAARLQRLLLSLDANSLVNIERPVDPQNEPHVWALVEPLLVSEGTYSDGGSAALFEPANLAKLEAIVLEYLAASGCKVATIAYQHSDTQYHAVGIWLWSDEVGKTGEWL